MQKKVTREDIAKILSKDFGIPYTLAYNKIDKIISNWSKIMVSSKLSISKIGSFEIKHKNSRVGRNPKSKIEYQISSRKIISFKKSKHLKI